MHTLVRRYIKTGIAFLGVGILLGLWSLVQRELGVPVKLIGLGEGVDDLVPFEAEAFVDALLSE